MILYNCLLYDCLRLLVINHILSPLSTTLDSLFSLCICVCFAVLLVLLNLSFYVCLCLCLSVCPFCCHMSPAIAVELAEKPQGQQQQQLQVGFGNALSLPLAALTKLLAQLSGSFRFRFVLGFICPPRVLFAPTVFAWIENNYLKFYFSFSFFAYHSRNSLELVFVRLASWRRRRHLECFFLFCLTFLFGRFFFFHGCNFSQRLFEGR